LWSNSKNGATHFVGTCLLAIVQRMNSDNQDSSGPHNCSGQSSSKVSVASKTIIFGINKCDFGIWGIVNMGRRTKIALNDGSVWNCDDGIAEGKVRVSVDKVFREV
jgi:hypothetical protein